MDDELRERLKRVLAAVEEILPPPSAGPDWSSCLAANWRRHSFSGRLEPVSTVGDISLADLLGIDSQKEIVERNTLQFLSGYPANNALLWGTRGTGKSSLVRALLNEYADRGLRVIQVDKNDLGDLPEIVDRVKREPFRFILFSDDVSFHGDEHAYKILKSALDGSVYATPDNLIIYVTSNRRHLLPEYETDNRGGMLVNNEIHHGEGVEEKISLSGRFGLWVAFHAFSQDQYVQVVREWAAKISARSGTVIPWTDEDDREAIDWSHAKGDRSGRIAFQFATDWVGRKMLAGKR